jgi:hypothetical protein
MHETVKGDNGSALVILTASKISDKILRAAHRAKRIDKIMRGAVDRSTLSARE